MSWCQRPLGEVIRLKRGHDLPASQRVIGEIPVISSSGITGYHNAAKAEGPGVVTGRYGTLGEVHYIEGPYWPLNTALYVEDFKGNYPRFVGYLLTTLELGAKNEAGAVPGVNRNTLHQMSVSVPDVDTQVSIATVLLQYDDLIETNRRRIALLEEAARLLYREWFVNLRFPGYARCKIVDGLPEGWMRGSVHNFVHVLSGGTPNTKTDRFWGGDIPFFTPKDCSGSMYVLSTEKTLTEDGLDECNSRLFGKETIFITARGTVGKLVLAQCPMAMNQSCYALAPKDGLNNLLLFLALEDGVEHLKGMASGGVFDTIIVDTFKFMPFVRPTIDMANQFGETVRPVFDQIVCLLVQNELLSQARDELLPKLMSGAIQV